MLRCLVMVLLVGATFVASLHAAGPQIGDPAPALQGRTTAGKPFSLESLKDAKLVVVCFTGLSCPIAQSYEARLVEFAKQYESRGVALVAMDVSGDDLKEMAERASQRGFQFPFVLDESQQSGKDFGAVATPQFFVLDAQRRLAYQGAFDDNWQAASKVKKAYVRDAVDALLEGKTPKVTTTRPVGCRISYAR